MHSFSRLTSPSSYSSSFKSSFLLTNLHLKPHIISHMGFDIVLLGYCVLLQLKLPLCAALPWPTHLLTSALNWSWTRKWNSVVRRLKGVLIISVTWVTRFGSQESVSSSWRSFLAVRLDEANKCKTFPPLDTVLSIRHDVPDSGLGAGIWCKPEMVQEGGNILYLSYTTLLPTPKRRTYVSLWVLVLN